jgi:sugar transferase (PEP-CTERM/EpsH1 system associated)
VLKVLLICPWLPWPPFDGARIRILETLKHLSAKHEVTLLANIQNEDDRRHIKEISSMCQNIEVEYLPAGKVDQFVRMVKGLFVGSSVIQSFHYNRKLAKRITEITASEDFDIIQIELSFLARFATAISPTSKAKVVLATHNIETQRFERELKLWSWDARHLVLRADAILFPHWEARALSKVDGALAVSELDRAWIVANSDDCPAKLAPNGVDVEFFSPERTASDQTQSIVFTGLMDYPPNVDAVRWFVADIFPDLRQVFPALQFCIVGARPSDSVLELAAVDGVEVTGEVPDIRPYVNEATAFVVPLRSGGGTRLKILQAMSMACPVISTAIGAEGLDVEDDKDILFAEDSAQFLAQVGKLLESPAAAVRIGEAGCDLVNAQYDWSACLRGLDTLYSELLGEAQA